MLPSCWTTRGAQRNPIAELPAVCLHQGSADERAGSLAGHGLELVGRYVPVRIDVEQRARIGCQDEHVVAPALVDRRKRAHERCAANPGDPFDQPQVRAGQRFDLADAAHDDQPVCARAGQQAIKPRVDTLQQPEEHEGDCDRQQRQHGARPAAPQPTPDEMQELHAAACVSASKS